MSEIDVLSDATHIADRIVGLENELALLAAGFRLNFKLSSEKVRRALYKIAPKALAGIEDSLQSLREALEKCSAEDVDPWNDIEFFQLSMQALGLSFPPDFVEKLASDDIVEGYDLNGRQIFRNMRFMEVSSYSLLEVLSTEWQLLFERPTSITNQMMAAIENCIWKDRRTVAADIPRHVIRELRSVRPLAAKIHIRYFAPLFSGPDQPAGWLGVSQGQVVEAHLDMQRDNLVFL